MADAVPILVVTGGSHCDELVQRLRLLEVRPLEAASLEEAVEVLGACRESVFAALIPVEAAEKGLKSKLKALRRAGPASGITFLAYGSEPQRDLRGLLRSAKVKLGLWEPFDDGTLRFQLNRAINGERTDHGRRSQRVPTFLLCRIQGGGRVKDAVVYSLAETGAFLETPRASMDGAEIEVEIRLPGAPVCTRATVVYSNVPGNLQRPNLPLGMGVKFADLGPDESKLLADYIRERTAQLEI